MIYFQITIRLCFLPLQDLVSTLCIDFILMLLMKTFQYLLYFFVISKFKIHIPSKILCSKMTKVKINDGDNLISDIHNFF